MTRLRLQSQSAWRKILPRTVGSVSRINVYPVPLQPPDASEIQGSFVVTVQQWTASQAEKITSNNV